ncbi:MBL fold metallo-hydrolase [Mangrovivirga sp. M17]|uniref:MBL fold metallo-hydrolase n=1 Tax=Mangrovivirga halotolerans TaxID=2993936 RepID=A0ABT3RNT4_9BACT|nr:MBL fold metallo-hydrolase [Mangrovivirga halotolerans]MCX2743266.1 MBL fold metallo-hydrolase [Mangrovivirga halotolerans]
MIKLSQFGNSVRDKDLKKFKQSDNWDGDKFINQSKTTMDINLSTIPKLLKQNFTNRKERRPEKPIAVNTFDFETFHSSEQDPKFIWYGHSVLMVNINGIKLLIDPMFGSDAAPISPFGSKRFSNDTLLIIDSLPDFDAILITHDHYDHLDLDSISKLKSKCSTWMVALGVSRHLESWGIPSSQITEFDWWDKIIFKEIELTFTPSRHFSGRGLFDRAKSLWGGWVIKSQNHSIYWSGDGGYDDHFEEIGAEMGPFDIGFMECGQYNKHWHQIHMYPEEAVKAAMVSKSKLAVPVHWGAFALALHSWKDPVKRFTKEAALKGLPFYIPSPGEVFNTEINKPQNNWWKEIE